MFEDTLKSAKSGDEAAIGKLLLPFLPALTAFVRLRLHPQVTQRESPADVVQSICREVLDDLPQVRATEEVAFRSWLFSVAWNKVRNKHAYHNAEKRDIGKDLSGSVDYGMGEAAILASYGKAVTPSRDMAAGEEVARIEAAFGQLPELYRDVLLNVSIAGLSYAEAGRIAGKSEDAVRQLVHRARARLATLLD